MYKKTILSCWIILIASIFTLKSQWVSSYGPVSGQITGIAGCSTFVAAGAYGGTVFISTDNGETWNQTPNNFVNPYVGDVIATENDLFAASNSVYKFNFKTITWDTILNTRYNFFSSLSYDGKRLLAGTGYDGVYLSPDKGQTWRQCTNGLPLYNNQPGVYFVINAVASMDSVLIAGGNGIIAFSLDDGKSWSYKSLYSKIQAILTVGSKVFIGTYDKGLYVSEDTLKTWSRIDSADNAFTFINDLHFRDGKIYAAVNQYLLISSDSGKTWTKDSLPNITFTSIGFRGDYIYGGTQNGIIWKKRISNTIREMKESEKYDLLWNPFLQTLTVKTPEKSTVGVFTSTGTLIKSYLVNHDEQIELNNIEPGFYLVSLKNGNSSKVIKIIIY